MNYYTSFNDNISLDVISATMMSSSPVLDEYESMSTSDLVKSMFKKVFGYSDDEMNELIEAQEQAAKDGGVDGFQYWVDEIENNPYITKDNLAIALLNGGGEEGLEKASNISEVKTSLEQFASYYGVDLSADDGSSDGSNQIEETSYTILDGTLINTGSTDITILDFGMEVEGLMTYEGESFSFYMNGTIEEGLSAVGYGQKEEIPGFDFPDIVVPASESYYFNDFLPTNEYVNIDGISGYMDIEVTLITTVGTFTDESHITL